MKKLKQSVLCILVGISFLMSGCSSGVAMELPDFPEYPEYDALDYVELCSYDGMAVTVPKEDAEVTDEYLRQLARSNMPSKKIEKGASVEYGDSVYMDYTGRIDGETFEGGSAENVSVVIGSGQFIGGFEDGIVGMDIGETKEISVKFPAGYDNLDLAGKDAVFTVTVHYLFRNAELTDKNVKANTDYDTVDEYLDYLKGAAEERIANERRETERTAVANTLVGECDVTVPRFHKFPRT